MYVRLRHPFPICTYILYILRNESETCSAGDSHTASPPPLPFLPLRSPARKEREREESPSIRSIYPIRPSVGVVASSSVRQSVGRFQSIQADTDDTTCYSYLDKFDYLYNKLTSTH